MSIGADTSVRVAGMPRRSFASPTVNTFPARGRAVRMRSSSSRMRRQECGDNWSRPFADDVPLIEPNFNGDCGSGNAGTIRESAA